MPLTATPASADSPAAASPARHAFPALRWLGPLWLAIYLPSYAVAYGLANFLFLCNLGVVLTAIAL
ncbi:MAG: hypothetical protein K8H90_06590, partial [Thermoanaerobaculia bacterium]|nr:hypothetical protein [Thermoanaerobaculia bacterium]